MRKHIEKLERYRISSDTESVSVLKLNTRIFHYPPTMNHHIPDRQPAAQEKDSDMVWTLSFISYLTASQTTYPFVN
ncbi:hypothetical protein TNCV_3996301 [Trichonephila clavipes]|nr:hypothetical protein TNCV_3996301 [Trichonephila clavipes]